MTVLISMKKGGVAASILQFWTEDTCVSFFSQRKNRYGKRKVKVSEELVNKK